MHTHVILMQIEVLSFRSGIVLALFTGTSSSAVEVHETFTDVIDDFTDYTTESIEQMFQILCQAADGGVALLLEIYGEKNFKLVIE